MPSSKLLRLLALSALVLLTSALSIDTSHLHPRHAAHHNIAMSKPANVKHCKPRSQHHSPSHSPAKSHNSTHPTQSHSSTHPTQSHHSTHTSSTHNSDSSSTTGNHAITVNVGDSTPKIGISYPLPNVSVLKAFKNSNVGYYYNWSPYCDDEVKKLGFKCVPMLWGYKQIADFQRLVKPGYAQHVLAINEPNEKSQSNMSPGEAADMWRKYIQPLGSQGYTLISPACTNGPSGKEWMMNFFNACNGCQVDAVALHWYGTNATNMIDYIVDFHNTFQRPIWVTEFACQDFSYRTRCKNVYDFLGTVKRFMDDTDWVHAYFAFGVMHDMYNVDPVNQLLSSDNKPTALGSLYIGQ